LQRKSMKCCGVSVPLICTNTNTKATVTVVQHLEGVVLPHYY
jgi:hypothetical protein